MKKLLLIVLTLTSLQVYAEHITGGEMYYVYLGKDGAKNKYQVTLKLYRDCYSRGAALDDAAPIAIYALGGGGMVWNDNVTMSQFEELDLQYPGPCITNAPVVCYQVGYYTFTVSLAENTAGYLVTYQRCCRINGITNFGDSGDFGATYAAEIPGTARGTDAPANSSAKFIAKDTTIVCGGYPFTFNFSAIDPDGDVLRYSFCSALKGGGTDMRQDQQGSPNSPRPNPPVGPPYAGADYNYPFSAFSPMGPSVTIDPVTGIMSGNSPAAGIYGVTVCVEEIRNGIVIATQRKDLQIKAGGCELASAKLDPSYITCDGFTMNFFNQSNSPLINTYYWEFGETASGAANTSVDARPVHTYANAGEYNIRLITNRGQECSDTADAVVKVWPGFFPEFNSQGICITNPVLFRDATTTNYGVVDSWRWDFGAASVNNDTSRLQNPQWKYNDTGQKNVRLIVTNSKGCVDTITKPVTIIDKPPIKLAFKDTLICVVDGIQLQASGTGNFSWSPTANMTNSNTATPFVRPPSTTTYIVTLDEQGCINKDSVKIRVVDHVTILPMPDSTICLTDTARLRIATDGLKFQWAPSATLDNATLQNPLATPQGTTTYQVTANIGTCSATDDVTIRTVPYPDANAGLDTIICYNTPAILQGSHDGSSFTWSPASTLSSPLVLNPIASPLETTSYVLTVYDTKGCPKPGRDTVIVEVLPEIIPIVTADTMVVVGQPLQFSAQGGVAYEWMPPDYLSNPKIANPKAAFPVEIDSIEYMVKVFNEIGCYDSAYARVTVFKTETYVFVASAFTPNGDGLNDELRPIAVGIQRINYFHIFNRWGQRVFSTTTNGKGWDGRINGVLQNTGVYVWLVSAIDYTGKHVFLKGTSTLIR